MNVSEKALRRFWAKVALPDENGCMLWTGARIRNGYGHMGVGETHKMAHRISLHLAVGAPPHGMSQAAHSCRNRHCVAPAHLRWATPSENEADRLRDGTDSCGERSYNAKLTDEQANEIRREHADGGVTYPELAARYGVSRKLIGSVVRGTRYAKARRS